jgi:hypothetical protein
MPAIMDTQEADIGMTAVWGQPRQKVGLVPSQQTSWSVVVCVCIPSYKGGIGRRIVVWGQPRENKRPYLKNNQ